MAIIPREVVKRYTVNSCFTTSHSELVGKKIVGRSICTNIITVARANLQTGIVVYFVYLDCRTPIISRMICFKSKMRKWFVAMSLSITNYWITFSANVMTPILDLRFYLFLP